MRTIKAATAGISILTLALVQPAWADESHPLPSARSTSSAPGTSSPNANARPRLYQRSDIRPHSLNNQTYYGARPWRQGTWRHESRHGRYGWWWDTGGVAYFYTARAEQPPDNVSDISEPDETDPPETGAAPEPQRAYLYRPGDLDGVVYDTLEACRKAQEDAGGAGVCVIK